MKSTHMDRVKWRDFLNTVPSFRFPKREIISRLAALVSEERLLSMELFKNVRVVSYRYLILP